MMCRGRIFRHLILFSSFCHSSLLLRTWHPDVGASAFSSLSLAVCAEEYLSAPSILLLDLHCFTFTLPHTLTSTDDERPPNETADCTAATFVTMVAENIAATLRVDPPPFALTTEHCSVSYLVTCLFTCALGTNKKTKELTFL